MVNKYPYAAGKREWSDDMEAVVSLWKHHPDKEATRFSDYLDAFVLKDSEESLFGLPHVRQFARDRDAKWKRSPKKAAPRFPYHLYSRFEPNPIIERLYNSINAFPDLSTASNDALSDLPPLLDLPTDIMPKTTPKKLFKSDETVDASFTNPTPEQLSDQLGSMALVPSTSQRRGNNEMSLKLGEDNPFKFGCALSVGRNSSTGQTSFKNLMLYHPIECLADKEMYELSLSTSHVDNNGIIGLKFGYPICSTKR